jgi:hypothetical protein
LWWWTFPFAVWIRRTYSIESDKNLNVEAWVLNLLVIIIWLGSYAIVMASILFYFVTKLWPLLLILKIIIIIIKLFDCLLIKLPSIKNLIFFL